VKTDEKLFFEGAQKSPENKICSAFKFLFSFFQKAKKNRF